MAQTTSELWKTLWAMENTEREYQFDINGTIYGPEAEVFHSVDSGLYEEFSIGNATIATLTLSLLADEIPYGATIKRYIRLKNGDQVSEWLPKGIFFTSLRPVDDGCWTIDAYDAMRKAETVWTPDQSLVFPMTMQDAVSEFARIMGVEVDERTNLNPEYTIDYPANDYTIRQELQYIAAAHASNFIITDAGKLLLVPILSIPDETSYLVDEKGNSITFGGIRILVGDSVSSAKSTFASEKFFAGLDITGFTDDGKRKPISRVTLWLDDSNCLTAGDDTGVELEADCPYATQAMVDNILAQVQGYQYQAYNADAANIDPAAELGDGATVNGVYSVIARFADDGSGYVGISAPGQEELEDEYPAPGPMTQEFARKIATLSSQIIKTSEEITLKIESTDNRITSLSTKIEGIELVVTSTDNRVTSLSAKLDSIKLSVTNGTTSSTIKLMAGSTEISSQEIKFDGIVTFDDLSTEGKTTIHGGNIQTETLRVQALYGSTVYLKTEEDRIAGIMSITGASTSDYAVEMDSYGALRFQAQTGAVYIASYTDKVYSSYIQLGKFDVSVGPTGIDFRPGADNVITLGTAEYYWNTIYCRNSNIDLSDRNAKENINYDMSRYDALFDLIRPCSYKFLDGDRTHWGVISQDFEQSLEACGFTSMDIAAFCKDKLSDGTERYAMRYTEMIPLLIWEVQSLKLELKRLKGEVQ